MDDYEKFRQIIDSHLAGAPKSKYFIQILQMLFSKEEIEVAVHMNFKSKSAESIAAVSSIPCGKVEKRLDSMADKAIILSHKKDGMTLYSLIPTVPGLFELSLAKKRNHQCSENWRSYGIAIMRKR